MTYSKISFSKTPDFKDIYRIAREYYVIFDIGAEGFYSIVLELKGNGKINRTV